MCNGPSSSFDLDCDAFLSALNSVIIAGVEITPSIHMIKL